MRLYQEARNSIRSTGNDREAHIGHDQERTAPVGRSGVCLCWRCAGRSSVCAAPAARTRPLSVDPWECWTGASGRGSDVIAHPPSSQEARIPQGSGPFSFNPSNHLQALGSVGIAISRSHISGNGRGERSLKTQREAQPKLVGSDTSHFADVAQLVARDHATVEAMGSNPIIRSMTISGVPAHKHWVDLVGMCVGAAAPTCSGVSACRVIACGHSRDGSCPCSSVGRAGSL